MVEVRLLGRDDQALLERSAAFDDAVVPARAAEFLGDPRHHCAAAIAGDEVIGFASAVHYVHPDKAAPELWINEVGVNESHRRQGLARRLMDCLFAAGRRAGCGEAWVLTESDNGPARALYQSMPGVDEDVTPVMYGWEL